MRKRIVYLLLAIFVVTDISYSFMQHFHMSLDGDMATSILEAKDYKKIFEDPLAIKVLTENAKYPDPNRFFAHWTFSRYFKTFPFFLQNFVFPIESIYIACAVAKTVIQICILVVIGIYINGIRKVFNMDFLIVIAILTPLFQTNGYRSYMGIIDPSITYTFFYALPCALALIFYLPFFNGRFNEIKTMPRTFSLVICLLLSIIITFNGPLIPGTVLIISLLYFYQHFKTVNELYSNKNFYSRIKIFFEIIPKTNLFVFIFISGLSIYSLYIGQNNSMFVNDKIPILERYLRLPNGIYFLVSQKIGFPLLIITIIINLILMNRNFKNAESFRILKYSKWIGMFAVLFVLLLPLGGYRSYRPDILRYDSIMPIVLALFFVYGATTYFIIRNTNSKVYFIIIIAVSLIFTIADEPEFDKNGCERLALERLSNSDQKITLLDNDCNVLSWEKIAKPEESIYNARLIKFWGITKEERLYYQK